MEGGRVREAADVLNRVACLQIWDFNNFDNVNNVFAAKNYKNTLFYFLILFNIPISPEQGVIMMFYLHWSGNANCDWRQNQTKLQHERILLSFLSTLNSEENQLRVKTIRKANRSFPVTTQQTALAF